MKILLFLLLNLISQSYAQELDLNKASELPGYSSTKADPKIQQRFNSFKEKGDKIAKANEEEKKKNQYTEEYSIIYLKLGQPIFSINGEKSTGQSTGIGHRRYAQSFIYGGELNMLNKDDLIKSTNINIMMGYQPIWKHRVTPYLLGYIGNSQAKYTAPSKQIYKANGYVSGLDLGFVIKIFQPIHFTGGMRYEQYNYSKKEIDSMSNQEFYFLLGYEF